LLKNAAVVGFRFGETARQDPDRARRIWEEWDGMVERGIVDPVVYKERYKGVEDIPRAMRDLHGRKVWGRSVVVIADEDGEEKARL
jgi:hypothetical protein